MKKRLLCAILASAMALSVAACSSAKADSSSSEASAEDSASESSEEANEDVEYDDTLDDPVPEESSAVESSEEVDSEEEPQEETVSEETDNTEAAVSSDIVVPDDHTNRVTGQETLSDEAVGKRSVSVMVNNALFSLPQYGISDADMIFEVPVEYGITRLMCVYGDYTKIPQICSVRSCRYYYAQLAAGLDTFYIHWGIDQTVAKETIEDLGIDHIDGDDGTWDLFDRDQDRLDEGFALEHTSRLDGPSVDDAMEANDVRTELGENYQDTVFQFSKSFISANGDDCTKCEITFSDDYWSTFAYNAEYGVYYKWFSGEPHMDDKTEQQLYFSNIVVLETDIGLIKDDTSKRREIDILQENANGYLITGGKVQKITWSKKTAFDPITIYNEDGSEAVLNTGKTYIAICDPGSFKVQE